MLNVQHLERSATPSAQLQVSLRGLTIQDHQINVFVNGGLVGSLIYYGQDSATQKFSVPGTALVEGDNAVKLVPTAAGNDVSLIDYVRLTYAHSFAADNDSIQFSIKSTQSPRIDGFTTPNIRMFDITDTTAVLELKPEVESSSTGFAATIAPVSRGKARRIVAAD
jgi:hypothetical protein